MIRAWDYLRSAAGYSQRHTHGESLVVDFAGGDETEHGLLTNRTPFVVAPLLMPARRPGDRFCIFGEMASLQYSYLPGVLHYGLHYITRLRIPSTLGDIYNQIFTRDPSRYALQTRVLLCFAHSQVEPEVVTILWAAVLPREKSLDFHMNFVMSRNIAPEEFGMEFWYDIETINKIPVLLREFRRKMPDLLASYQLKGREKTTQEMASLIVHLPVVSPSRTTSLSELRKTNRAIIEGTIKEIYHTDPAKCLH